MKNIPLGLKLLKWQPINFELNSLPVNNVLVKPLKLQLLNTTKLAPP